MIRVNTHFLDDPLSDHLAKFVPGELIEHVREHYRGVVVAVNGHCKADPAWYMSHAPLADRDQPWYFVLVDGTAECVYPPEEDLRPASEAGPIQQAAICATITNGQSSDLKCAPATGTRPSKER